MTTKHTPGPWHASGLVWNGKEPAGIFSGTLDPEKGWINSLQVWPPYDCDPNGMHYQRHAADLRLMSAAPELKNELAYAIEVFEEACQCGQCGPCSRLVAMRDAIAKAEGGAT